MKRNKFLAIAMAAAAVTFTSCSKTNDTDPTVAQDKNASLTVTITGQPGTRAVGTPEQQEENVIVGYTVYVLNAQTDIIQAKQSFSSGLTNRVTGLTAGPKRIVVVANDDSAGIRNIEVGLPYSTFDSPSSMLNLSTQTNEELAARGLVMSGETSVTLVPGDNNSGTISLKRVVAKVKLGTVTMSPIFGHQGTFVLNSVHIMKARSHASFGTGEIYTSDEFYGGIIGSVSTQGRAMLSESITLEDNANRYFYVFPNDNTDGNATLLTLEGNYDGRTVYFPIRINDNSGIDGSTSDGSFIKRNTSYVLNINIKRPGDGSPDPEVPVDPATLELTITPENWETELVQNIDF